MGQRNFNRLGSAIDQRNAKWLQDCYPDVDNALRQELADGATPEEVAHFVNQITGDQEYFGLKVKSAARHIERQNERRR